MTSGSVDERVGVLDVPQGVSGVVRLVGPSLFTPPGATFDAVFSTGSD